MKRLLLSLLVLGVCTPVSAQVEDTTSAWRYLALEVGNVWEYERWEDECVPEIWPPICTEEPAGFLRRRVADEVVRGDTTFMVVEDALFSVAGQPTGASEVLVRFDTTQARAYEHRLNGGLRYGWPEAFLCPLDLPFEGGEECEKSYADVESSTYDVLGEEMASKRFTTLYGSYTFVADVGLIGVYLGKFTASGYNISYARVGGRELGVEQFPVARESVPAPLRPAALTVYPNPAHGETTLGFALGRSQRATLSVYDVLGRRVRSEDLGALPAGDATQRLDLGGLPAGLYVAQLAGDVGAVATARLVVQ